MSGTNFLAVAILVASAVAQDKPYAIKEFTLGESTLQEFKARFHHCADNCASETPKFAPFCSDTYTAAAVDARGQYIQDVPSHTQAGLVYCQPYFPFEGMRGEHFTIAEIPTTTEFDFYQGKLYRIAASFDSVSFMSMQQALTGKYGLPSITTEEYQNGFGAKFNGTIAVWENGQSKMILTQYTNSTEYSGLTVEHKPLAAEAEKAKPKKSSKDL